MLKISKHKLRTAASAASVLCVAGCVNYVPVPVYPPAGVAAYPVPAAVAAAAPSDDSCRQYQMAATIDGKQQQVAGVACKLPDGTWQAW